MGGEIGIQTQTFTIFPANETAITVKIAQLKVCILNSVNSLNDTSDTSETSTASMPSVCTFEQELSGGSDLGGMGSTSFSIA